MAVRGEQVSNEGGWSNITNYICCKLLSYLTFWTSYIAKTTFQYKYVIKMVTYTALPITTLGLKTGLTTCPYTDTEVIPNHYPL
jgi:hypothetical protein